MTSAAATSGSRLACSDGELIYDYHADVGVVLAADSDLPLLPEEALRGFVRRNYPHLDPSRFSQESIDSKNAWFSYRESDGLKGVVAAELRNGHWFVTNFTSCNSLTLTGKGYR